MEKYPFQFKGERYLNNRGMLRRKRWHQPMFLLSSVIEQMLVWEKICLKTSSFVYILKWHLIIWHIHWRVCMTLLSQKYSHKLFLVEYSRHHPFSRENLFSQISPYLLFMFFFLRTAVSYMYISPTAFIFLFSYCCILCTAVIRFVH